MQLIGAESIQKKQDDFLVGAERGGQQTAKGAVGGAASSGTDDGGHQIEKASAVVIGSGEVGKAERWGGHRERIPEGGGRSKCGRKVKS